MTIDVKRLAVDADYWEECGAPEDATHVGNRWDRQPEKGFKPCWYRKCAFWSFMYPENGEWHHCAANSGPSHTPVIPRPQPQPEWVDGLPPAGTVCECYHTDLSGKKQWVGCDVVGPYGDYVICAPNGGGFYGFDADELRPLPTKAQRDRDELADLINKSGMCRSGEIANKIIAAGWTKP